MKARLRPALLAAAAFAGGGTAARAGEATWEATCDRVKTTPFPAEDQPDQATAKTLAGCRSEDLYYGVGQPRDPQRARLCAYVERTGGDSDPFGGSAVLMMVYATGNGARRNVDLALRLACSLEGVAPAEMDGRIAHLEKLRRSSGRTTFDLCDDITSGYMMGMCAAHDARLADAKRAARFRAKLAGWTDPERAGFEKLRQAARGFFEARSSNEVDLSGTARAEFEVEEEQRLEDGFEAFLDQVEKGAVPTASDAELAEANRRLNAAYQKVMRGPEHPDDGTVITSDIRKTERTWPKYRDAWTDFAAVKFPRTDRRGIRVRLTQERTRMLEEFVASGSSRTPR